MAIDLIRNDIDTQIIDKLVKLSNSNQENGFGLMAYGEGCMLDNYVFCNFEQNLGKGYMLGRHHKVRKYIIIKENYLNCWSSTYQVIETNSAKKVKRFINEYELEEY